MGKKTNLTHEELSSPSIKGEKSKLSKTTPKISSQDELERKIKELEKKHEELLKIEDYEKIKIFSNTKVSIKELPRMNSTTYRKVNNGTVLRLDLSDDDFIVIGEKELWYRVKIDNRIIGYVKKKYAKTMSEIG